MNQIETLEWIEEQWDIDCPINQVELDVAALDIPKLHNKYFKLLKKYKIKRLAYKDDYQDLLHIKSLYYTGKLSKEELEEYGYEPFHHKVLKNDLSSYYEADKDLKKFKIRIDYNNIIIEYLDGIIDQINRRTFSISAAIKWRQFTSGEHS